MKKSLLVFFSLFLSSVGLYAQQLADGYYRVRNASTDRYLYLTDTKGYAEIEGANPVYDLDAIVLRKNLNYAISDPGSVIYVSHKDGYNFDLSSQGTSIYQMTGRTVIIRQASSYYAVGATQGGFTKYLSDKDNGYPNKDYTYGILNIEGTYTKWEPVEISSKTNNYFGINPSVTVDAKLYAPFFAEFGFAPSSTGIKVYYISAINEGKALVCAKEITGDVPNNTPVFIECKSDNPSNNRINPVYNSSSISDNVLKGNYLNFSNDFLLEGRVPEAPAGKEAYYKYSVKPHTNRTPYDPKTMRVLGEKDGKLAFVKATDLEYLPANQSYLVVSEGAPDCLFVVSEKDYALSIESMTEDNKTPMIYNLLGKQVSAKGSLSAGIYIINGKKTVIR